ncbi:hypothetical protein [Janthinobacterium sp. DSP2-3-3]|uniref:hypothetical protein n=1 Tax=Janthinobacterium sp. DSP2-3-3 TaxID=2804596 RepID=UPI003CECC754
MLTSQIALEQIEADLESAFCIGDSLFEAGMAHITKSLHHLARAHLDCGTPEVVEPPPTNDEIRRQLGIALVVAERQTRAERDERN